VNFCQINDIIGDEEWLQGEVNCMCNIASSQIISFSWGAKKKESTNSDALCICVGDHVSVENHGKHWIHHEHIISIDNNTNTCCTWSGGTCFQLCCCVSFSVVAGNSFRCYLPTLPVVPLFLFLVVVGNSFGLHRSVFWLWQEIVLGVTYLSTMKARENIVQP
jgi:hypothetical protein